MKRILSFILALAMIAGIPVISFAKTPFFQDPDAIQKSAESVLLLTCYDKNGNAIATASGFLAFEDGIIVTNYHVVEGDVASIQASTEDGLYFDINDILCFDATADIAILKTKAKTRLDLLKLGNSNSLKKGSRVVTIGSPKGFLNAVSEGLYSGVYSFDNGADYILFTAAISHGSSGGALFNDDGEVVGITSGNYDDGQNLNLAVPIERVIALWESYNSGTYTVQLPEDIAGGAPQMYSTPLIVDGVGIFSPEEISELLEYAKNKSDLYQCDIAVLFVNGIGAYSSIEDYTNDYFDFNGYGYKDTLDGIMLAVDLKNSEFWISTSGKCVSAFTETRLDNLGENFLPDLSNGDYYSAAKRFIDTCIQMLEDSKLCAKIPVYHFVIGCPPETGLVEWVNNEIYKAYSTGFMKEAAEQYDISDCLLDIDVSYNASSCQYFEDIVSRGVLKIGVLSNAPFTYQDDKGNWIGFDIALAQHIANSHGLELEIIKTIAPNKYRDLKNHTYDLLFCGLTSENDTKVNIDFSIPYILNSSGIDKTKKTYTSIEEFYIDIDRQEGYLTAVDMVEEYLSGTEYYEEAIDYLNKRFYKIAKAKYDAGEYDKARIIFHYLGDFRGSEEYVFLIDARDIRGSLFMNILGNSDTYDKLLSMLSFADTKDVIMEFYPEAFLDGKWKTRDKQYTMEMRYSTSRGTYVFEKKKKKKYTSGSSFSINKGIYTLHLGDDKKVYKFTIQDKNTIIVYCFADNTSWTLYRQ